MAEPYIQSDNEARTVARMLQDGTLKGDDATRAQAALRVYTAKGPNTTNPEFHATLGDVGRSIEQGASYQWLPSKGDTEDRERAAEYSKAHPISNVGLEAAGGAGTAAALGILGRQIAKHAPDTKVGKLAGLLTLADQAAKKAPISNWQLAKRASVVGGAAGAVSGAGSTPTYDPAEMAKSSGEQGLTGMILGPLTALGVKYGVANPITWAINKIRGTVPSAGGSAVINAMAHDQTDPASVQASLNAANRSGVPSTVADVAGPRAQAVAQAAAAKPGEEVDPMILELAKRNQGANERVSDLVNKFLKPDPYRAKMEELTKNLYANAKPLYDQAYKEFPAVKSDTITQILGTKYGRKAGQQAEALMQADGVPLGKPGSTNFSLQYLDYVKRALDDQINVAERTGASQLGRTLRNMRTSLRDELDARTAGPQGQPGTYAQARGQYAGDLEIRDALEFGRDEFLKLRPEELTARIAKMSYMEKDALRSGVAENLFTKLANLRTEGNPAQAVLSNPGVASRLQLLFDKPSEYKQFVSALNQEMQNFARARAVTSAGASGRVSDAASELSTPVMGELGHAGAMAISGHPYMASSSAARALGRFVSPAKAQEAAGILRQSGPDALSDLTRQAGPWNQTQMFRNLASFGSVPGLTEAGEGLVTGPSPSNPPPDGTARARGGHVRRSRSGGGTHMAP